MIARRLSLPRMRSPDCGYSSTKSSASNRSCASTSLVIIACMNCSTVARLSLAIALSSPGRRRAMLRRAYACRKARRTLRANVLLHSEGVVGILSALESAQALVLLVAVYRAHDVVTLLDHVVHVISSPRERLQSGHRRAAPGDVLAVSLPVRPEGLGADPIRRGAAGERCGVLRDLPRSAPLGPEADRAPIRRDRALLRRAVDRSVRELVAERALHVEALAPRHLFVAHLL